MRGMFALLRSSRAKEPASVRRLLRRAQLVGCPVPAGASAREVALLVPRALKDFAQAAGAGRVQEDGVRVVLRLRIQHRPQRLAAGPGWHGLAGVLLLVLAVRAALVGRDDVGLQLERARGRRGCLERRRSSWGGVPRCGSRSRLGRESGGGSDESSVSQSMQC